MKHECHVINRRSVREPWNVCQMKLAANTVTGAKDKWGKRGVMNTGNPMVRQRLSQFMWLCEEEWAKSQKKETNEGPLTLLVHEHAYAVGQWLWYSSKRDLESVIETWGTEKKCKSTSPRTWVWVIRQREAGCWLSRAWYLSWIQIHLYPQKLTLSWVREHDDSVDRCTLQ